MSKIDFGTNITAAKAAGKTPDVAKIPSSKPKKDTPFIRMSRRPDERIYGDYNTIDEMESENSKIAKMEMWLAKGIGEQLLNHYPNRQWGVQVNIQGQTVIITCPSLSKEKGYYIHLKNETPMELAMRAVNAAGEILERYNLSRARKFDSGIIETLDRDHKDEVISVDASPEAV